MADENSIQSIMENLMERGGTSVEVGEGWAQGRALYGGLVGALAAQSMASLLEEERPIRSLMGNFVAPAPTGELEVRSEILRQGRAVVQTRTDVVAGDQVCFAASAAFGDDRPGVSVAPVKAFDAPPRDSVPPMPQAQMLPGFLRKFDVHWTGGGVPMSNSGDRTTSMWVRNRADMSAFPIAKIVSVADMPPPVILAHYDRKVMASSMTWSIEFIVPPSRVEGDWFYLDYTLDAAASGYSQQSGLIYDEEGRLVALSRQCMVYFEQ